MPIFNYVCEQCAEPLKRLLSPEAGAAFMGPCPSCQGPMRRAATGPTGQVVETIDNGLMARRVERNANIQELVHKQAQQDAERSKKLP